MQTRYLRMLQKMRREENGDWNVYIVRCVDGTFYTGVAKNVLARIGQHNLGRGAAYTRARRPVKLLHQESSLTRSAALIREAQIKALPRSHKARLFEAKRPAAKKAIRS